jgi:arylsulfatase A-like enzyme
MGQLPNLVVIMTDQQRADVSRREGFPLDTTPFLDDLAQQGTWFDKAYTATPVCTPARVSMLTGRYPSATHVRTNHNAEDVFYDTDLIDVLHEQGYTAALCGKNHSYLTPDKMDYWFELSHTGGFGEDRTPDEKAFDQYLANLNHRADLNATPFPLETQCPHRAVTAAINWIDTVEEQPFFLWLSFPEPHNPYQVPEPYFSVFPPETLPPTLSDESALQTKSFKYHWTRHIGETAFANYDEQLPRARANYFGMLRLIDDQIKRFVNYLDYRGLRENTLLLVLSDHGDFVGEYGLVRKGPELPEVLTRIPFFAVGPGIKPSPEPHPAHVSLVDVMPTLCEAAGAERPPGVQGRSLWSLLTGNPYPEAEFTSSYVEHGFGGLHYTASDSFDPTEDGLVPGAAFDELNGWSQSGAMRMVRKGEWKLLIDMQGEGQLYHLTEDPVELVNLYDQPECAAVQQDLMTELVIWMLRVQDPLPYPRRRYKFKAPPHGYWSQAKED